MVVAVYFSFAKKFNSVEWDIEIHTVDEIDVVNTAVIGKMRDFLNFTADLIVGVVMLVLNLSVGLLILVELIVYSMFFCIRSCWRCCHVDHNSIVTPSDDIIGSTDDIYELTGLLEDSKISSPSSTITKEDLKAKMEMIPERFCFLKCLKASDRDAFIEKYIAIINTDEIQWKYYDKGVITVSTWMEIMRGIELQNNYRVYRDAYWGENTGIKHVSSVKVIYKSMLVEFGSEHISTVDLLIANKHISRIYYFRRSSFVNVKQWFWDNIIGYEN